MISFVFCLGTTLGLSLLKTPISYKRMNGTRSSTVHPRKERGKEGGGGEQYLTTAAVGEAEGDGAAGFSSSFLSKSLSFGADDWRCWIFGGVEGELLQEDRKEKQRDIEKGIEQ